PASAERTAAAGFRGLRRRTFFSGLGAPATAATGVLQHFRRVVARAPCDLDAAQHARDLLDALGIAEQHERRPGALAVAQLDDTAVTIREARDLRQVGDAQHLARSGQRLEPAPDHLGDAAAHTRVHLVEHHRRDRAAVA